MYLVSIDASTRELARLEMIPLRITRFRLNRVSGEDARWLREVLAREGAKLGTRVELGARDHLALVWR
jgi:poly-gamma-glutamate synthesis protein (capsule biosynthesis protein)